MRTAVLRQATPIELHRDLVAGCLDLDGELDRRFETAWRHGLGALERRERTGALPGVTGHIAESVVELILGAVGFVPIAHHPGPGRHGVDLLMLHLATDMLFAIEVKGTLKPRRLPRLTRGEIDQMSAAWLDKLDNPAMSGAGLHGEDVFAAVAVVNFADMTIRIVVSADGADFQPIARLDRLSNPAWLRE